MHTTVTILSGFSLQFKHKGGPFGKCTVEVMSCESKRTKAYNSDQCQWMVYQVKVQNLWHREVARNLCVDQATVSHTAALFDDTGDVKQRKHPCNPGIVNVTGYDKLVILGTVIDQPDVFLKELQSKLESTAGNQVDVSTL